MFIETLMIFVFLFLGVMLLLGKGSFLIAGFNTLSEAEKESYDTMHLCTFMGKFMFVIAISTMLCTLSKALTMPILFYIGTGLITVSIIFVLIYMNTGNRFKK